MRLYTPDNLLDGAERVRWLVPPFLALGALTLLTGPPKLAGKTTWMLGLISSLLDGSPFLDQPTTPVPVIYYTEESRNTFYPALERAGLTGRALAGLQIALWRETVKEAPEWGEQADRLSEAILRAQAGLLVIDTFAQLTGLHGESENNAGEILAAIKPLQIIAEQHQCAVLVIHHDNKSGGSIVSASRGSSALPASVDILIRMTPLGSQQGNSTTRVMRMFGRFDDIPPLLAFQRIDCRAISQALLGAADGCTVDSLVADVGMSGRTIRRFMDILVDRALVQQLGTGRKGNPIRFVAHIGGDLKPPMPPIPPFLWVPIDPGPLEELSDGTMGVVASAIE